MRTVKRAVTAAMSLLICLVSAFCFVGCKKDNIIKDGKTVNVRMYAAGYGTEWVYELKNKFEKVYADEGYKINILEPSNDMLGDVARQEMALGVEKTGVDVYITGNCLPDTVGEDGDFGVLAEDIEQIVYDRKPINYDGEEEDKLISEKLEPERATYTRDSHGVMYHFPYTASTAGLAVNTAKLARYGLTLPRTTNELLDCIDKIYRGNNGVANSEETKIFPVTYVSGTNGYVVPILDMFMAQYDRDQYKKFWNMQETTDGQAADMLENGYDVFELDCVKEMLALSYALMDVRIAAYGSTTQNLDQAQAKIMSPNSGAVFMFNGSWMLNEVRLNYRNEIDDLTFINTPLNSALGTKLMGEGTSYDFDDDKCDKILSHIAGKVDENKSVEEITASVRETFSETLSEETVTEIARARGVVYDRGLDDMIFINKNSPVKDIAALMLRMMASDDFAQTWLDTTNSVSVYSINIDTSAVPYDFVKSAAAIVTNKYKNTVSAGRNVGGLRKRIGLGTIMPKTTHIPSAITSGPTVSIYNGRGDYAENPGKDGYYTAAENMIAAEKEYLMSSWEQRIAGIASRS